MKKIFIILIILTLIFCLFAGCGTKPDNNNPEILPTNKDDEVDISIIQYKVEAVDALNEAIELYKNIAPNVSISLETIGGGDDIGPILKARLQSGTLPTIFNIGGPSDVELYEAHLEDLSNEGFMQGINRDLLSNVTKNGKIYGLPYAIEGFGLIINKEIFSDAGVDLNDMNSFEKISQAFKKVNDAISSGQLKEKYPNLVAVTEVPGAEPWVLGDHASNIALSPEYEYSAENTFNSVRPQWIYSDAYKNLIDLQLNYSNYADNRAGTLAVTYSDQVQSGLALERVACIQQGNWIYNDVKQIDEDVAQKLDILPLPTQGENEDSIFTLVPMYWCVSKNADENEKQAAKDFLNWLYRSDEGKELIVEEFGFIPPYDDYGDLYPDDPLALAIQRYQNNGKVKNAVFKGYPDGWASNVIGVKIQGYIDGSLTWEEALTQAADEWEKSRSNKNS